MSERTPFTTMSATAAVLLEDNVDTDQIIPARFLKYSRAQGYGGFLLHDRRFDADGKPISDFVLNREAARSAQILVAGANFGGGSSREGAVYALADYGIRCVVASGFGPIFYKNCFPNGILPATVDAADIGRLLENARDGATRLTVDIEASEIRNEAGYVARFRIEPFFREMLMLGVDEIGLTLGLKDEIAEFEKRYLCRNWHMKEAV
ncbi:MAG: 3-isopropylmalate dehydratase small subunit [Mesorhizobium sp.]